MSPATERVQPPAIEKDPRITELVCPGIVVCGGTLCRLGEQGLVGPRMESLPQERVFPPEQLGDLTGKVLPELARRMPVDVKSQRLPRIDRTLQPRISLDLKGAVPVRDEGAEQKLIHQLRDELNMVPGRRVTVQGRDAVQLADKLRRWRGGLTGDAARVVSPNVKLSPQLSVEAGATQTGMLASFTSRKGEGSGHGAYLAGPQRSRLSGASAVWGVRQPVWLPRGLLPWRRSCTAPRLSQSHPSWESRK